MCTVPFHEGNAIWQALANSGYPDIVCYIALFWWVNWLMLAIVLAFVGIGVIKWFRSLHAAVKRFGEIGTVDAFLAPKAPANDTAKPTGEKPEETVRPSITLRKFIALLFALALIAYLLRVGIDTAERPAWVLAGLGIADSVRAYDFSNEGNKYLFNALGQITWAVAGAWLATLLIVAPSVYGGLNSLNIWWVRRYIPVNPDGPHSSQPPTTDPTEGTLASTMSETKTQDTQTTAVAATSVSEDASTEQRTSIQDRETSAPVATGNSANQTTFPKTYWRADRSRSNTDDTNPTIVLHRHPSTNNETFLAEGGSRQAKLLKAGEIWISKSGLHLWETDPLDGIVGYEGTEHKIEWVSLKKQYRVSAEEKDGMYILKAHAGIFYLPTIGFTLQLEKVKFTVSFTP